MPRTGHAALLLCAVLLAGCASARAQAPDWKAQPAYTPEPGNGPGITPGPDQSGRPQQPTSGASGPPTSATARPPSDPAVVATGLIAPSGIAVLPDGSALVGERTTGRILRVQGRAGKPVQTVRTLTGLDASGDGGLLDLALSPTYAQDGLVYAYLTTPADNRVVDFTLTGPATPVFTGIPRGATDNLGRIAFDTQGNLLIGTGDAGQPALAGDPTSLAGKVLEVTDVGRPASGASPVFTTGHHTVGGLCVDPDSGVDFETEPRSGSTPDEVNALSGGDDYGWPSPRSTSVGSAAEVPSAEGGVGGCAVLDGNLFVASLDDDALLSATFSATTPVKVGAFAESLKGRYGRLLTVVAAPDGTLWLTTSNKDGHGTPVAADERVLHLPPPVPPSGGTSKA
jgi:glucose/arabinose dehydrogenase